jgi:hypothetical protein
MVLPPELTPTTYTHEKTRPSSRLEPFYHGLEFTGRRNDIHESTLQNL